MPVGICGRPQQIQFNFVKLINRWVLQVEEWMDDSEDGMKTEVNEYLRVLLSLVGEWFLITIITFEWQELVFVSSLCS